MILMTLVSREGSGESAICPDSPEPSLLSYSMYRCKRRLRPKFQLLFSLDMSCWAFIRGICAYGITPEFFSQLIYKRSYCNFLESRIIFFLKLFFLFYPPTLHIICFNEKNNIFLKFCLCIFESDTVNSDCPVQIFRKMMKYLKIKYRQ